MRALAISGLIALASCGPPALVVWDGPTAEEHLAFINSARFQSGVIYDCVFEPDAAARAAGQEDTRQLIYDEDGSEAILYSEPPTTDGLETFDRTVRGATEVFVSEGYKRIEIDTDGSSRMTLLDVEYDRETFDRVSETPRNFTGLCRRGPGWPLGSQAPWCPADPTLAQESCIVRPEQSAAPITGPAADGLEAVRLPECPRRPADATERCIRRPPPIIAR